MGARARRGCSGGLNARAGDYAAASGQVRRLRGTVTSFPRLLAPLLAIDAAAVLARGEGADAARAFELAAAMCVDQGLLLPLTMIPREDLAQLVALTPGALSPETAELVQARGSSRVHDPFLELTASERRMLTELVTPQPLREIAERLVVSINTVKTQTRSVYRKVGATSRDERIALARRHGYA